jgi:cold shock CspA family protein
MSRHTGVVTSYSTKTGYGFITDDRTGDNIFVHQNDINIDGFRFLDINDEVEFDLEGTDKGQKACSVDVIKKSNFRSKPVRKREPENPQASLARDMASIKADLRILRNSFDRLIHYLKSGDDPILIDEEINDILKGN